MLRNKNIGRILSLLVAVVLWAYVMGIKLRFIRAEGLIPAVSPHRFASEQRVLKPTATTL